jgi:hypothetical protein
MRAHYSQTALQSFALKKSVQDCSRTRLAPYPLRSKSTSSLAFPTTPHAPAAFKLRAQRTPYPGRRPDNVTRRAEACAVTRAQDDCFSPKHVKFLFLSLSQYSALAREPNNFVLLCPKLRPPRVLSFAACGSVHGCSRALQALYSLGAKSNLIQVLLRVPHSRAALVTHLRHIFYSGCPSHEVTRRAEACTVARAQNFYLTPQSEEKVTVTFLKSAAHKGGLSNLSPADQKLGRRLPLSYAARRDVHDHPLSLPLSLSFREEDNLFKLFLRVPHLRAGLAIQTRRISRSDRLLHQVAQRAEACITARALIRFPIPSSAKKLAQTSLQTAAHARASSTFASPHFRPQKPHLQNYEACKKVHSRMWPLQAPHLLIEKNSSFRAILRVPRTSADLATQPRRRYRSDQRLYQIAGHAEACLTAGVLVCYLIPPSLE